MPRVPTGVDGSQDPSRSGRNDGDSPSSDFTGGLASGGGSQSGSHVDDVPQVEHEVPKRAEEFLARDEASWSLPQPLEDADEEVPRY